MAFEVFKGIGQVTWESFSGLTNDEKIGKLWFVKRTVAEGGNDNDAYGEIYFGTRHYGHFSQAEIDAIAANKEAINTINTDLTTVKGNVESQGKSIEGLQTLVDSIAKYEYKTVEESVVPEEVKNSEGVAELPSATKDSDEYVKVVSGETATYYKKEALSFDSLLNAIEAIRNEYKVKSVNAEDKVLSVDASGVLSAELSLKYDSDNKKIYLYGKDGKTAIGDPIDATAFIKDGMLETAEIVNVTRTEDGKFVYGSGNTEAAGVTSEGKYIRLHFNTDSGKKDVFLSVSEMVKAYAAGKDVEIKADDNSINVATSEDVTILGGPLADDITGGNWPEEWIKDGNKYIPAGKSLTEILTTLFFQTISGDVKATYTTWSPNLGTPTPSISDSKPEVNAELTLSATPNTGVTGNNATVTVTASQGYFLNDEATHKASPYKETISGTVSGTNVVTLTWNNSEAADGKGVAKEGSNTLRADQSGLTATIGNYTENTIYASTNTKVKLPGTSVVINTVGGLGTKEKALTSDASMSVNAYYPIYTNGHESATGDTTAPSVSAVEDDGTKLPLVADGTTFGVAFGAMVDGGIGYRIVLHKSKKISSAMALNGLTKAYEIDQTNKFVKASTAITKQSGGKDEDYYVWEYKGTEGANRVLFKIAK